MTQLVDVRCPRCGAPLRIDPRAPFAVCTHCRVQSRVERVASAADLDKPGSEGVIRVVVTGGAHLAWRSLVFAGALFVFFMVLLTSNYLMEQARPHLGDDARYALDLSQGAARLDSYRALAVLRDGSVVIGSESGQLAFVSPAGEPSGRLDLPLPATRARLSGLSADATGGFYASLGGAILHVTGPPFTAAGVGPALPADPAARVYDAVAVDARGQLHAATTSAQFVRVAADGSASDAIPLGVPTYDRPLELGTLAFTPDGRVIVRRTYGDEAWSFDPTSAALTPLRPAGETPASSIACLPDGDLVYDTRRALVRLDANGAHTLDLARASYENLDYVAAAPDGGVVALSVSGMLVRYAPERLQP